jgi:hypothetical protein
MLNAVEPADSELRDMIDAEYGLSGAYIHGDQLASYEVFRTVESGSRDLSSIFAEQRIISVAMLFAFMLMEATGRACGREYGTRYYGPKMHDLFREP